MTSLALMYVHRDIEVGQGVTDIDSQLARRKPRKLLLPNILCDSEDNSTATNTDDDEDNGDETYNSD